MEGIKWVRFAKYQLKVQEYVTFSSRMTMNMKSENKRKSYNSRHPRTPAKKGGRTRKFKKSSPTKKFLSVNQKALGPNGSACDPIKGFVGKRIKNVTGY